MPNDRLTYKDLYDAIDKRITEVMTEFKETFKTVDDNVNALRNDFMTMEKGRLTALERDVIAFKATIKTYGTIFGFIVIAVQIYLATRG